MNAKSWTATAGKTGHPQMLYPEIFDVIKWTVAATQLLLHTPGQFHDMFMFCVHYNTAKLPNKQMQLSTVILFFAQGGPLIISAFL